METRTEIFTNDAHYAEFKEAERLGQHKEFALKMVGFEATEENIAKAQVIDTVYQQQRTTLKGQKITEIKQRVRVRIA